jgi:hypothetical protein
MLDGGSSKAQPIEFQLFCFKKKPIDVSHKYIHLIGHFVLP